MKSPLLCASLLAFGTACQANANSYGEAAAAYKAEVKSDDPVLINAGFAGDLAGSQAKRSARNVPGAAADDEEIVAQRLLPRGHLAGSGIQLASPTIFGTVRGDVTIVVSRFATGGSITSVRR
jgi:hypothetical protein